MSTVTIVIPDSLEATVQERMHAVGAESHEAYLLALLEDDCQGSNLDSVLLERLSGPFETLPPDWKEQVRARARELL